MKKLLVMLFFIAVTSSYAETTLENDPAYKKAKKNVELLRQNFITYAKKSALKWGGYGATLGGLWGMRGGLEWTGEQLEKIERTGQRPTRSTKRSLATAGIIGGAGEGAFKGAAVGAVVGTTLAEAKRRYTIWYINDSLSYPFRTKYNFLTMPLDQAIMVYAAYQQNLSLMKKMKPQMEQFLEERGVWAALAELYFSQLPVSANVEKLKKLLEK